MNIIRDLFLRNRFIEEAEAKGSYRALEFVQPELNNSHIGLRTLDYFFFKHRIKVITKKHSFYDLIHDEEPVSYTHLTLPTNREV